MNTQEQHAGADPVHQTVRQLAHGSDEHLTLLGTPWHWNLLVGPERADMLAFGRACMEAERNRPLGAPIAPEHEADLREHAERAEFLGWLATFEKDDPARPAMALERDAAWLAWKARADIPRPGAKRHAEMMATKEGHDALARGRAGLGLPPLPNV